MGMTLAQKVLARASGKPKVEVGEIVTASVDVAMTHDAMGPLAFKVFEDLGADRIWDKDKIIIHIEHSVPPIQGRADLARITRDFAKKHEIRKFLDCREGICFHASIERGHILPGQLVVCSDSHTCTMGAMGAFACGVGSTEFGTVMATGNIWLRVPETIRFNIFNQTQPLATAKDVLLHIAGAYGTDAALYKAIEFGGPYIEKLDLPGRLTLCNMGIELGAKAAMVNADTKIREYLKTRTKEKIHWLVADPDASYEAVYDIDAAKIEPLVSCPHDVGNVKKAREVAGTKIQQAVLGTCTNGRYEDLQLALEVIGNRTIHPDVRFYIFPNTKEVHLKALQSGMIEKFTQAGAMVGYPSCGSCVGYIGALTEGEVCISSQNRNFRGRIGSPKAEIYLGSPATVAASAIRGQITDPRDL